MRIHLKVISDGTPVPFNHQHKLTGTLHKWIGKENTEHGSFSMYSFSMLEGGRKSIKSNGLEFKNGSYFFISAVDEQLIKNIISNIQKNPVLFDGLKVYEIVIQEDPVFTSKESFVAASPVLVKRRMQNGKIKHCIFNEAETT